MSHNSRAQVSSADPSQQNNTNPPSGSRLAQYLHGTTTNGPATSISNVPPTLPYGLASFAQMGIGENAIVEVAQDGVSAFLGCEGYSSNGVCVVPPYLAAQGDGAAGEGSEDEPASDISISYVYQGANLDEWRERIRLQPQSSFFVDTELKADLISRQLSLQPLPIPHDQFQPSVVGHYHELLPLGVRTGGDSRTCRAVKSDDGRTYCLKRIPTSRPLSQKQLTAAESWKRLSHASVVKLSEVFTTLAFDDNCDYPFHRSFVRRALANLALVFVYDHHPLAVSLKELHFGKHAMPNSQMLPNQTAGLPLTGLSESTIWSYVIQLSSAIRHIHSCGLAVRNLDLSKILLYGKTRVLISSCGIVDVLQGDRGRNIIAQQVEDLHSLGQLLLMLIVGRLSAATPENVTNSMHYLNMNYSPDARNVVHLLYGAKNIPGQRVTSINELMPMVGARFYGHIESLEARCDFVEDELSKEVENGRLFRLLCKLSTVCSPDDSASWNETSEKYLLRLFRNYIFHQFTTDVRPWVDMSHIVSSLNKLDAGVEERIQLVSRDGNNVLIVSYAELRKSLEIAFHSLLSASGDGATNVTAGNEH